MVSLEARDPSESPLLYDPGVAALSLAAPPPPEQETGEPSRRPAVAEDGGQLGTDGVVLKLLLPEKETGHVIGKGGAILTKIKQDSNTRIRISALDEVIPVTRERVCTIIGTLPAVLLAQKLISGALVENAKTQVEEAADRQRTLKLLLSHAAVGCVIGRGGTLIKEMMLQTGTLIKASQPAELIQATNERWLSITGTADAIDAVVAAVMAQILQSPAAQQLKELDYACLKQPPPSPAGVPPGYYASPLHHPLNHHRGPPPPPHPMAAAHYGYPPPPPPHPHHPHHPHHHPHHHGMGLHRVPGPANGPMGYKQFMGLLDDNVSPEVSHTKYQEYLRAFGAAGQAVAAGVGGVPTASETMRLPDKMVSGLIGKGGAVIKELMARSGAQIQVSQKSEAVAGDRVVTMTGSADAVATAQHFIKERLKEIEAQSAQRGPGGGGHAPAASPPHPPLPPDIYRHQAAYQQHSYMAAGYTHTAQPSPFLQPGMGHMALTMGPQSGMSHTMFGGQPGQFQQWQ